MQLSRACLSPWQIDVAELFSSQLLTKTTAEHLSRLESFIHAFLLFDTVVVPERYRNSTFLRAIDVDGNTFATDARISSPYKRTAEGQTQVDVDPSLLFKNRKHLRRVSDAWLKQHLTLDSSKQEREEIIEHLNRRGQSRAWFYQLILADYQVSFDLAMANAGGSVVFASQAQVYLADVTELRRFARFLSKMARTGTPARPGDILGVYSFELPTGGVEARVKAPSIFAATLKCAATQSLIGALRDLRQHYSPLRAAFRSLTHAFISHEGNQLVCCDMSGKEIEEWNELVTRWAEPSEELLLLKSEVVAVEVRAGEDAGIFQTLRDRVRAGGSLLRLVPPQSHLTSSRSLDELRGLGIETVIPFEQKLFRLGRGYVAKRRAWHQGLGLMISFPLAVSVQLTREQLSDPGVRCVTEERQPHLYMICTRPRITVSPEIRLERERIDIEFRFHHGTHIQTGLVSLARADVQSVVVDDTHTEIFFHGSDGKQSRWRASLLYQSLVKSVVPDSTAALTLDPEGAGLSEQQIRDLAHADLEVIYIGQSKGRDFDRTAVDRLHGHEKWETFYRSIADRYSHCEIWILLLSQSAPQHLNMALPRIESSDHDSKELIRRARHPIQINPLDCLNFTEAALISYFKPRHNDCFKNGTFPSKRHESYERLFLEPVDVAAIELETLSSMGFRLYSEHVLPRAVHLKMWRFNSTFDVWNWFATMGGGLKPTGRIGDGAVHFGD